MYGDPRELVEPVVVPPSFVVQVMPPAFRSFGGVKAMLGAEVTLTAACRSAARLVCCRS